jgi:putative copper resistance protein D
MVAVTRPLVLPAARKPFRPARAVLLSMVAFASAFVGAGPVSAHGSAEVGPPDATTFLLAWSWEPTLALPLISAALVWLALVRRVNRAHRSNPVPRRRTVAFLGGLFAIALALMSGIERYDTILFSVHMVQHLLLALVAAPLLAFSAPITLLLRVASPEVRRRRILPFLHSRAVRALSFPVVAGVLFAAVLWASHFSPVFDLALENPLVHDLEHAAYLGTALLFWWPAVAADPGPWRLSHPARAMYVFVQMPQNTFLAVALLGAPTPLYEHYTTLARTWGPTPLEDQKQAAGIMWLVGDLMFLAAILLLVAAWMRHEERRTQHEDRRADVARVAIREREARLAASRTEPVRSGDGGSSLPTGQSEPGGIGASSSSR